MRLKKGVKLVGLRPETLLAIHIANEVYNKLGFEFRVTSITDGVHSRASLHYVGFAFDCGVRGIDAIDRIVIEKRIRGNLTIDFDVVLESDHIHIEYQPKR